MLLFVLIILERFEFDRLGNNYYENMDLDFIVLFISPNIVPILMISFNNSP
jgi:hypothetical protein